MKPNIALKACLLLASMLAAAAMLLACGSESLPESREFELIINEGKLDLDPPIVKVKQGDDVTLKFRTDEGGEIHLHGYDLKIIVAPEEVVDLTLTANATGKFDFEMHPVHDDHDENGEECKAEIPAGESEPQVQVTAHAGVEPGEIQVAVELQNFTLGSEAEAGLAVGHWHLYVNGEIEGMYQIPQTTALVQLPGEYEIMVRLTDTRHCAFETRAMTTVAVEGGSTVEPQHDAEEEEHDDGEDGIVLGSLEVHPR
jgi:hypothetical protein